MSDKPLNPEELARLRMLVWIIRIYGLEAAIVSGLFSDKTLKPKGEIDAKFE